MKYFKMEIELGEDYLRKLFKLFEKVGSSGTALSDIVEKALQIGIDKWLIEEK